MNKSVVFHAAVEAPRTFRVLRMRRRQIETLAEARLEWILAHAAHIPFYRPLLERAGVDPWRAKVRNPVQVLRAVPLLDKGTILAAGDAVLDGGRIRPEWISSRSSGSTGEPFRVHYDRRAWAILKLLTKARSRWACGVRPWHRIVILDPSSTTPRPPPSSPLGRVRRIDPASRETDDIAAEMAAFRPDVVYGLPSVLLEVGRAARDAIRPRIVFTSGELLTAGARARLERRYGSRVHDIYGSSETKEIAWECANGSLHVNADVVCVEIVDDGGHPLPAGSEGRIVATLLVNTAMPLIRYVTGDRGSSLPNGCACGLELPRLGLVTGREADYLDLGGGRRVSPYRLTCAVEEIPGIRRFQVVQRSPTHIAVHVEAVSDADRESIGSRVRDALGRIGPVPLTVSMDFDGRFELGPGGKFRVVHPLRYHG